MNAFTGKLACVHADTQPKARDFDGSTRFERGKKHKYSVEWDNAVQLEGRFDLKPLNHHNSSPIYTAGPKL